MARFFETLNRERNYGCRIREFLYKGLRLLCMENELIRISIVVDKGTDIIEFLYKPMDTDFLWHSFAGLRNPRSYVPPVAHPRGSFIDSYEGGWQELFPNISDDCVYMGAPLGIHGEVAQNPWEYRILKDEPEEISVKFWIRTVRTPYLLEKVLSLTTQEPVLRIEEEVVNEGRVDLQFMWGHHPAFGPIFLDEHCRIEVPEGCKAKTNWTDLGKNAVLPVDTPFDWPLIRGLDGKDWDVSRVPPPASKIFIMCYLYDIPRGWYRLTNTRQKLGFELRWERDLFPILWMWAPYGGCEGYPWYGRNYNLALEPWSAIPHNLAQVAEEGLGIRIGAGERIKTSLEAEAVT
ncbi:MAG TPA: aldose 1-epimerase, partial [Spirochaetia bacterium]|nr:aldose 1-epimerase [Spirochaetia bacterium]